MKNKFGKLKEAGQYYYNILPQSRHSKSNPANISIFGMSRGGTTWLAEILLNIPHSTLVWEPLFRYKQYKWNIGNPFAYPEQIIDGFDWNQHIPEDEEWPEVQSFFTDLFLRKILNLKLLRFNKLSKVSIKEDVFLYKFCFGNLMLPWLVNRFNIKPILFIRHPAAVIASSLNFGNNFDWHKRNAKVSFKPYQRYNREFEKKYMEAAAFVHSAESLLAYQWGVQYEYLINHPKNNIDWLTVSYESLYLNPQSELKRIFNYINMEIPKDILSKFRNESFSSSANHSAGNIKSGDQLSSWNSKLKSQQLDNIFQVLELMGIDFYNENPEPNYKIIYNL